MYRKFVSEEVVGFVLANNIKTIGELNSLGWKDTSMPCIWRQDDAYDGDGNWSTSCGEMFTFIDDTPKGNGMKYCCYCGAPLSELPYELEPEEESDGD
jgi:hypothetical protein